MATCFISDNLESNRGLFKMWRVSQTTTWRGLDYVSILISSAASFFALIDIFLIFNKLIRSNQELFAILGMIV